MSPRSVTPETKPQSVQTMPSKWSSSRRIPVMTDRLYPKPTSSYSVPTGIP